MNIETCKVLVEAGANVSAVDGVSGQPRPQTPNPDTHQNMAERARLLPLPASRHPLDP